MSSTQEGSSNQPHGKITKTEKNKQTRRTWSPAEEAVLLASLKELITIGWKSDNGFKPGYLLQLELAMKKEFPRTDLKTFPHINSKIQTWKRNYYSLSMMTSRSGVGFNTIGTHMIDCCDDQWDQILKADSNAKSMRYKQWPMFDDWKEIFGKDRATGDNAEDMMDAINEMMQEKSRGEDEKEERDDELNFEDTSADGKTGENSVCHNEKGETVNKSSGNPKKRKATDPGNQIVELLGEITRATNGRLDMIATRIGYEYDLAQAKTDAFELLEPIPDLSLVQKFVICEIFAEKPGCLLIYKGLPPTAKQPYVQRLLDMKKPE